MFKRKIQCIATIILSIIICSAALGQKKSSWEMQPVPTQTRWAKEVSPENVLPEYPRPQLVRKGDWQSLNGLWEYAVTDSISGNPSRYTGNILVPFPIESALSGVQKPLLPNQILWYKRFFNKPIIKQGERLILNFGAVDWQANVYINGQFIGSHRGGYNSFSFDITSALKDGNNEIVVKVYDPSDQGIGPHGKQTLHPSNIYYTSSSGIWQTVWLESVPNQYINDIVVTPDIDKDYVSIKVNTGANMDVEVITSYDGVKTTTVRSKSNVVFKIPIKDPHIWSPENPDLYDLQIRAIKNHKTVDEVSSYFGMRKVGIEKDSSGIERILLNGKPYYNLGCLDQGYWPEGLYTAPTDSALKYDIVAMKAMGFNTIRKHIKVEPARWYYYADKIGMIVWQDFVNPNQGLPQGAKEEFEKGVKETMHQLYNFPCVTTWVIFNEKWGQYDQKRITEWVREKDSTRIINGHSGELLYVNNQLRSSSVSPYISSDLTDIHAYPDPLMPDQLSLKASVIGEYGGLGAFVPEHQWNEEGWGYVNEGFKSLKLKYKKICDSLVKLQSKGLAGSIYTQSFDVEGEQNGLITYDRKVLKMPLDTLIAINKEVFSQPSRQYNLALSDVYSIYEEAKNKYKQGIEDEKLLYNLILLANGMSDTAFVSKIGKIYLRKINNNSKLTEKDKIAIKLLTTNINASGFSYILSHISDSGFVNDNKDLIDIVSSKIKNDVIHPKMNSNIKMVYSKTFNDTLHGKYGDLGSRMLLEELSDYYSQHNNIDSFISVKNRIYRQYPNEYTCFHINNDAWFVFNATDNIGYLEEALKWSEKCMQANPTSIVDIDTYANILYKIGRKDEALRYEKHATTLAPDDVEITETLRKMKNGEKTWK